VAPEEEELQRWTESIAQSVLTGATYSVGFPLTLKDDCNDIGQIYFGPVVLITDALCYSTTDIFAAGFQDHAIGIILGTSGSTGAGGANVWGHENLLSLLGGRRNSPLEELPKDVGLRVAIRRSRRIGERAGTPLEEFGVTPNEIHRLTKRDVLHGNVDLINHAAEILSRLSVKVTATRDGNLTATIRMKNVSGLEVILNEEKKSLDVQDGKAQLKAHVSPFAQSILRLRGFEQSPDGDHLVAIRNIGFFKNPEVSSMRGELKMVSTSKKGGSKQQPGSPGGGVKQPGKKKKSTGKSSSGSKQQPGSPGGGGKQSGKKKKSTSKSSSASKSSPGNITSSKGTKKRGGAY
jgi:hypothetical protein